MRRKLRDQSSAPARAGGGEEKNKGKGSPTRNYALGSPKMPSPQKSAPASAGRGDLPREPDRPEEDAPQAIGATSGIPVVGLGGSAGALESFKGFFTAMPADSGAAFVVIQHLAPAHESLLTELLAQYTRMRVAEARDHVPVEPNCVYVIPPNHYLGLRDGVLYLVEPITEHGIRMPIDYFFRSLAEDRQERAIGILFSGAGSDGRSSGLKFGSSMPTSGGSPVEPEVEPAPGDSRGGVRGKPFYRFFHCGLRFSSRARRPSCESSRR